MRDLYYYSRASTDYLAHYGILGMKWGVRRYQNPDGTLTEAGKKRYLNSWNGELNQAGMDKFRVLRRGMEAYSNVDQILEITKEYKSKFKNDPVIKGWTSGGKELHREYQKKVAKKYCKEDGITDDKLIQKAINEALRGDSFTTSGFELYVSEIAGSYAGWINNMSKLRDDYRDAMKKELHKYSEGLSEVPQSHAYRKDLKSVRDLVETAILNDMEGAVAFDIFKKIDEIRYDY